MVDRDGLENRCTLTGTQGSNPCLSANNKDKTAVSQRLAAVLILYTYKNTYKLKENPGQRIFPVGEEDVKSIVLPV